MFIFSFFDWRVFRSNPYLILFFYFLSILSLLGLFFFAPYTRGVKGWYKIGHFAYDPIEPTKIILIILLAKYFSTRHIEMYQLRHILISGLYVLLPTILIFFQPDFGSAIILIGLWIGILLVSGIKIRHFLILSLIGIIFFTFSWFYLLKDYQRERIRGFLMPHSEKLGINWSQTQAEIAIGSGGILGKGFAKGSQTQYGFLSVPQTDFIFSAIAEEFGLVGVLVLLLLFITLLWRIIKISLEAELNFPRLFSIGLAVVLFIQFFIHIGVNLGFLPVIGVSLPLVSYGGSGLLMTYIGLGILLSMRK